MRMFDAVVIACDQWSLDLAIAIRSSLELYRLRAYLHFCVQKQNVIDFLGGRIPDSEYIVLCSHGLGSTNTKDECSNEMKMGFNVVDKVEGKWELVEFALTPANIPELINLPRRKVVSLGCGSGREPFAMAFLDSGCQAYIGPIGDPDQDSAALFAIIFFYHLLSSERDPALTCTDREAVERAASLDVEFHEGTNLFRYYGRK